MQAVLHAHGVPSDDRTHRTDGADEEGPGVRAGGAEGQGGVSGAGENKIRRTGDQPIVSPVSFLLVPSDLGGGCAGAGGRSYRGAAAAAALCLLPLGRSSCEGLVDRTADSLHGERDSAAAGAEFDRVLRPLHVQRGLRIMLARESPLSSDSPQERLRHSSMCHHRTRRGCVSEQSERRRSGQLSEVSYHFERSRGHK